MSDDPNATPPLSDAERITRLEARLAGLEARLEQLTVNAASGRRPVPVLERIGTMPPPTLAPARNAEQIEFEMGRNWFAAAGIIALTIGGGFMLCLPYAEAPPALPSLVGYVVIGLLFILVHVRRAALGSLAIFLCGAAMALLHVCTLRLTFPAGRAALALESPLARTLLIAVVGANLWIAHRQKSQWLAIVALAAGGVTVVVVGAAWLALALLGALALGAVVLSERENWRALALASLAGTYGAYSVWALGWPFHDGSIHLATSPAVAPLIVLLCAMIFAGGAWWRQRSSDDRVWEGVHGLANCGLGYGVFFVHTLAAFQPSVGTMHALAFVVYLGLAVAFWLRHHSRLATFLYAMTGYVALSVAILRITAAPAVFVWLSLQSVVVVATAVWFRSRFIVVANFLIYLGIVGIYLFAAGRESGISVGFGLVALFSARILNWQQHRLELKTELMRNAYLVSAFAIFPYALAHLAPGRLVALAWIGLASLYYGMNLLVRSPKYRWMGHATLGLTMIYVVVAGTSRFEPVYRVLSFLTLGTVLLIVSLSLARARRRV